MSSACLSLLSFDCLLLTDVEHATNVQFDAIAKPNREDVTPQTISNSNMSDNSTPKAEPKPWYIDLLDKSPDEILDAIIDSNATELTLGDWNGDGDVAAFAQRCKKATRFLLYGCYKITDKSMEYVATLPLLRTLYIGGCVQITDAGLQRLSSLTELRKLAFEGCKQITDSGLLHLAGLPNLRAVHASGSSVTSAGKAAFLAAQRQASAGAAAAATATTTSEAAAAASEGEEQPDPQDNENVDP